jgi:DNA-binding Lrp family transcriptional regulator
LPIPFYILLHTKIGQSRDVVHAIQKIEGVKVVHSVMGNYDVILYGEGKDLEDIRRIRWAVEEIKGVTITETLVHA